MFGQDANQTQQINYGQPMATQPAPTDPLAISQAAVADLTQTLNPANQGPAMGAPAMPTPVPAAPVEVPAPAPTSAPAAPAGNGDDLLNIKQDALQQLGPLVGHLEQSPEEKFRTTMMMIQASDNQALVKEAYEAAKQIPDEKARAQALLDVINEINYFTQHHNQ